MAVHGGDIYFDVKINKKSYQASMAGLNASASKAGESMSKAMNSSLSNGVGKLDKTLGPTMAKSGAALGTTFAASMGTAIAAIPIAGWIVAAIGALYALTNKVANLGDEIDKNSQKMGMSAEGYQEWSFILDRCGASMDSMKGSMKKLATAAEKGNSAFTELGISQQELSSMNQEQIFGRTIQALQNVEDGTRRTYLANQLLGKGATELGAVFNMTNAETDELRARLEYLGGTMSEQGVKNSAAFKDSLTDLKMAFRGFGNFLAEYIAPIFTWLINHVIIPFIVYMRKLYEIIINVVRGLAQLIGDVFRPLISLLGKIPIFGKVFDFFKGLGSKKTSKGLETTASSMEDVSTGVSNTGSSAKKTKKEVQALKRELLGFDKITKLQGENKGTSSDSGTTSPSYTPTITTPTVEPIDTSTMFDTSNLDKDSETWYQKLKRTLGEKWNNLKTDIKTAIQDFWKWVDEKVGGWWDKYLGGKKLEINLPTWEELKKQIDDRLGRFWKRIQEGAAKLGIELPSWPELKQKIDDRLGKFWKRIQEGAGKLGIELPSWPELKQKLDDRLGRLWERFRNKNNGKIEIRIPTWAELKDKWKNLMDKFKEKKVKISLDLAAKWNNAKAWINNNVVDKVNAKIPKSLKKLGLKFPYLAQGGFVKANTPQLAMIGDNKHEGEIVAPESKLAAMAAQAASSGNEEMISLLRAILATLAAKDTNVYLDGEEIKNNVVNRINRHTKSTGQLEILV